MSSRLENPMASRQALLREQLPLLWESYHSGRFELVEEMLRQLFAFVQTLHVSDRKSGEAAYLKARQEWMRWQKLDTGLREGVPEYGRLIQGLLPELEKMLRSEPNPEIKAPLSFCLGGLKRLSGMILASDSNSEPPGFPRGLAWEQVGPESIDKAVAGLRDPGGKVESPAQLLGRLESIAMNWWYSHLHLSELFGKVVMETQLLAEQIHKRFQSNVGDRILPVLDAIDTAMDDLSERETLPAWAGILAEAQHHTHALLSRAGVRILPVGRGEPFDPATQHGPLPVSSYSGRPWIVSRILRRGYRTEFEILRFTEVELIPGQSHS